MATKKVTKPKAPKAPEAPEQEAMTKAQAQQIAGKVAEMFAKFDDNADQQKAIMKEMRNVSIHMLSQVK